MRTSSPKSLQQSAISLVTMTRHRCRPRASIFVTTLFSILFFLCLHQRKFLRVRRGYQASQRKGRTSGEVRETSGEVRGTSGEVWETSGESPRLLLSSTARELPGKSPKNSGEVWGTSEEVRGLSRSSGEPDPLPATRQSNHIQA